MIRSKSCKTCIYFSKEQCGYVASDGKRDKGGNAIKLNFNMRHNCPDYNKK